LHEIFDVVWLEKPPAIAHDIAQARRDFTQQLRIRRLVAALRGLHQMRKIVVVGAPQIHVQFYQYRLDLVAIHSVVNSTNVTSKHHTANSNHR